MDGANLEPEKRETPKSKVGAFFVYAFIFGFGFLAAVFGRGSFDTIKSTASLAGKTAGEVFLSANDSSKVVEVPIRKSKPKVLAKNTPKASGEANFVPAPTVASSVSASTSVAPVILTTSFPPNVSSVAIIGAPAVVESSAQSPSMSVAPPAQNTTGQLHLLIYEVQITGGPGKSEEDFIRVFNPNNFPVDISGWKLRKKTKSGSDSSIRVIPDGTSMPGGGVLMWANNQVASKLGAQVSSSATIASDNSIAVLDKDSNVVDSLAWGSGHTSAYVEGAAFPTNPEAGQTIKRKVTNNLPQDTNNNAADFTI